MSENKLVSIIMPAYNCENYIDQAIRSILDQSYKNWELIICDDASEDNSLSIIKKYAARDHRIIESHNEKNQKLLKTRNRLLTLCKGDYITFQDADDISDEYRIQSQLQCFIEDSNLGICGSSGRAIFADGTFGESLLKPEYDSEIKNHSNKFNAFIGSSIMISAKVYKDIGGFRSFFDGMSYQDYDWSCLISEKYKAYNVPQELYLYRQHENSNSKIIDLDRLLALEYVRFLRKQRLNNEGNDALSDEKLKAEFEDYIKQIKVPYQIDSSLIYREYASWFMYAKLYKKAIKTSWNGIIKEPLKFKNYKTLNYCIRKSIFK